MTPTIDEPLRCPCCHTSDKVTPWPPKHERYICDTCGCVWYEDLRRPAPPADVAAAVHDCQVVACRACVSPNDVTKVLATFAALRAKLGVGS